MLKEQGLIPLNKTYSRAEPSPTVREVMTWAQWGKTGMHYTYLEDSLLHSRLISPGHNAPITSPLKSATKGHSIPSTQTTSDC